MKNLSNRNKVLLALGGVLVIIVVAVVIFTQPGGGELLGASTTIAITPSNPNIVTGQILGLNASAPRGATCKWTSSNVGIVAVGTQGFMKTDIKGLASGQATVTATCTSGSSTYVGSTVVKVSLTPTRTPAPIASIEPADARLAPLNYYYFNVKNKPGTCTSWTTNLGQFRSTAYCSKEMGDDGGCLYTGLFSENVTSTITAVCGGKTFTTNASVGYFP